MSHHNTVIHIINNIFSYLIFYFKNPQINFAGNNTFLKWVTHFTFLIEHIHFKASDHLQIIFFILENLKIPDRLTTIIQELMLCFSLLKNYIKVKQRNFDPNTLYVKSFRLIYIFNRNSKLNNRNFSLFILVRSNQILISLWPLFWVLCTKMCNVKFLLFSLYTSVQKKWHPLQKKWHPLELKKFSVFLFE